MKTAINFILFFTLGVGIVKANYIFPRIINGYNATVGQFPWIVALSGKTKSGDPIFCNGALISSKTILTVAQCLEDMKRVSISLGSVKRDIPLVHTTSQNIMIHYKYNATTFANNIGLIKLSNPLSFTRFIKPVQLPSSIYRNEGFTNMVATVSGFGRVNNTGAPALRLQFAKVKIISEKKCQSFYGSAVSNLNTLCSIGTEHEAQGACPNDNGSPLVVSEKLTDILIGLTSFISTKGCDTGHPTGYVRVSSYLNWIRENSEGTH